MTPPLLEKLRPKPRFRPVSDRAAVKRHVRASIKPMPLPPLEHVVGPRPARWIPRRWITLALLVLATMLGGGHSSAFQSDDDAAALERRIVRTFGSGEYEEALELVTRYLQNWPGTPHMLYNRACGLALLGRREASAEALLEAVEHGFRDFAAMRRDPDLASMRNHETFTAILEASHRIDRDTADRQFESWQRRYGDDYHYETDTEHRLHFATGLDAKAHADMKRIIGRQADQMTQTLFKSSPQDWCFVVVPAKTHVTEVFRRMLDVADPARTPGVYLHGKRLLVTRDIGESLRHEFAHRMHWADMDRRGQRHPMWVQEGLASLYEEYVWTDDDKIKFVPNMRHNIARRQVQAGIALSWDKLFDLSADQFLAGNARFYPQVRSMFEFLAALGLLEEWYDAYVRSYDRDPGGGKAFELVFGLPLDQVNQRWKSWVLDRGSIDDRVDYGDASIGISGIEAGDGVQIERVIGRNARRAGLRRGDVITRVDEKPVRARGELMLAIAARKIGETVRLEIRRRDQRLVIAVRLEALRGTVNER
ncbi:MAG: PDZ domain-containing protein [Phycisphaerales bacterium]|nr:PDZ domain-containing protein [Phycisphaerales bacterium]